jgi:hypothetical protein
LFGGNVCEPGYGVLSISDCQSGSQTDIFYDATSAEEGRLLASHSNIDGFHHFQTTVYSGSALGYTLTTTTDYAVDNEELDGSGISLGPCGTSQTLLDNWLGNVISYQGAVRSDTGNSVRTKFGYDAMTGGLTTRISLLGQSEEYDPCNPNPAPSGSSPPLGHERDVVLRWERDSLGQVEVEETALRDGSSSYRKNFTWDGGMLDSVKREGASFYDLVAVNDVPAALRTDEYVLSTDALGNGGVRAHIAYDGLRRPVAQQIGNEARKILA